MSFDLEKAIAAWRRPFEVNPVFSAEDIEELEGSLRDRVAALRDQGRSEEDAFRRAVKRSGAYSGAETEYRKVYWSKLRKERRLGDELLARLSMVKNDVTLALRMLRKQKGYAFINMFGLAIGLASCLLIANYMYHALSYDRFHEASQNIYRINTIYTDNSGTSTKMANSPPALLPGIRGTFPEIKRATRLRYTMRALLERGPHRFYESRGFYADSSFLELFSFPLVAGDRDTALDEPNAVVLTQETAAKYFGQEDPLGKVLTMNNDLTLRVTGVLAPIPATSHLQFDFLVSFPTYEVPEGYFSDLTSWGWLGFLSYVQLQEGVAAEAFQRKLDELYRALSSGDGVPYQTIVQPLEDIYFGSADLVDDLASNLQAGNRTTVYVLGVVALLILLIASFNFANLAVAISTSRSKGVALRSILGAEKGRLVGHLLAEPVVLALLSLVLAYLLSLLAFPYLKEALGWNYAIDGRLVKLSLPFAVAVTFVLGLLAGLYPALVLSGQKAVFALKQGVRAGSEMRSVLIAFQFGISIALISATLVINKQMQHLSDQALGFDQEQVVMIKLFPEDMGSHYASLRERLLANRHFVSVTRSERTMGEPWPVNALLVDGRDPSESKQVRGTQVGYDYFETLGIDLVEGRAFSEAFPRDRTNSIILSEQAVAYLGLEDPVGQDVHYFSLDGPRTIIGVVEDINYASLHHEIAPMVLIMPFIDPEYVYIRLGPGNQADKIAALEAVWEATIPGVPLDFRYMDDHVNSLYASEQSLSYMIGGFTGLALILASLGLYGLIAFSVNQRKKEVGIRKVLGASVPSLLVLFSRQYVVLIVCAAVVAVPVIQYVLGLWLEGFAYRVEISWWVYALATLSLAVIAFATISHQAIRASLANPVQALRNE